MKNPQFPTNKAEIQAILLTHEFILTKFHYDWVKTVDILLIAYVWAKSQFFVLKTPKVHFFIRMT